MCLGQVGPRRGQAALGFDQFGLERLWIDGVEEITLADEAALDKIHGLEETLDPCPDRHVLGAERCTDHLYGERHIATIDRYHADRQCGHAAGLPFG